MFIIDRHSAVQKNNQLKFITDKFMLIALVIHILLTFIFFWMDLTILGYVNIVSSFVYLVGYYINKRGHTLAALYMGHIEIVIHAAIAVYLLGSGSGFQYYILDVIILTFIAAKPSTVVKSFIVLADTAIFVILTLVFRSPVIPIDSVVVDTLHFLNIIFVCASLAIATYLFRKVTDAAEENLRTLNKKLETLANTDGLTKLLNRRCMMEKLIEEVQSFNEHKEPFTLILADIDRFKSINDTHGHDCGDLVLKKSAEFLKESLGNNHVARWGGEEFLFLLRKTEKEEAYHVVEELRRSFEEDIEFQHEDKTLKISLTFGLAEYNDAQQDVFERVNIADKALMQGKNQGKNCVVVI